MHIYLIPGLGADHRLFGRLELPGHEVYCIDWPEMPAGSTLQDFAEAIAGRIDPGVPHVLVGVSMGGMVAQELAAITHPVLVIIISSWKGPQEMPWSLRLLRGTHPESILSQSILKQALPLVRWEMGVEEPEEVALFDRLMALHPVEQLKRQINACLTWNGPAVPVRSITHIHGDRDRLMPISHVKDAVLIKGGSHFMVYNKAQEVGEAVKATLRAAFQSG